MSQLATSAVATAAATTRKLFTLVLLTKSKPVTATIPSSTPTISSSTATTLTSTPTTTSPSFSLATSPYSSVLLGYKKRGFGSGKYNGFGGKLEPGESVRAAALREMKEEAGIDLVESSLTKRAILLQEFEGDPCVLEIHVYLAHEYNGSPVESEEMRPEWFDVTDAAMPFKTMWLDDSHWYPWLLNDQYFRAHFLFRGHDQILSQTMELLNADERKKLIEEDRL